MYKIETKDYGYKLTLSDIIYEDEMKQWLEESKSKLRLAPKTFGIFVDMRALKPLPSNSQKYMEEGQKLYKEKGMQRSVVILANATLKMQFKRIARETGIDAWERYIDEQSTPNWEQAGIAWLKDAKEPE